MSSVAEPDPAAPPAQPSHDEQRGDPRHVIAWGSFCLVATRPESRPERVLLHDVSAHGIALVFSEPPPVGTVLALQLPGSRPELARFVGAEVRHATQLGHRIWLTGCALTSPPERGGGAVPAEGNGRPALTDTPSGGESSFSTSETTSTRGEKVLTPWLLK